MSKTINIVGAFDRYNYGDLLFPIVIEKYLKKYKKDFIKDYEIDFYGLVESNLSSVGGKKTKPLSNLYKNIERNSIVIVAGGDVIPARISSMDIDLSSNNIETISKKVIRKLIGLEKFEKKSMKKFELNSKFPWVIEKDNFKEKVFVTYNAIGASTLSKLSNTYEQRVIKENVINSDYVSVRDNKSLENLRGSNPHLYPDSATIMSEFFTLDVLEESISENVKNIVENAENGYICIQSNLCSIKGKEKVLAREIEEICKKNKLKLVLLPIGFAANHDDNIALNRLKKHLKMDCIHNESLTIYEVMYLIAKSKFFAGTSLHGNITSMSYGVPHIGLNKSITKLDEYLRTWDLKEQNHCIDFEDLSKEYEIIKKIDKDYLEIKRKELINLSRENFNNMFKVLEDKLNE